MRIIEKVDDDEEVMRQRIRKDEKNEKERERNNLLRGYESGKNA